MRRLLILVMVAYGLISTFALCGAQTPSPDASTDPTVIALEQERLRQEIEVLERQNETGFHSWRGFGLWLQENFADLGTAIAAILVGLFAVYRYSKDKTDARCESEEQKQADNDRRQEEQRRYLEDKEADRQRRQEEQDRYLLDQKAERDQRAEERFRVVVAGLGSNQLAERLGSAVSLRLFLQSGEEQFYLPVYDLAASHLRQLADDSGQSEQAIASLRQALSIILAESFQLARDNIEQLGPAPYGLQGTTGKPRWQVLWEIRRRYLRLNGSGVGLQGAMIRSTDFRFSSMKDAKFDGADLTMAVFHGADLHNARFAGAQLREADFEEATAMWVDFRDTQMYLAKLEGATLIRAKFTDASMSTVSLKNADLENADLELRSPSRQIHFSVRFDGADLTQASLKGRDLSQSNIEAASHLEGTILTGTTGLTAEQIERLKGRGAIFEGP